MFLRAIAAFLVLPGTVAFLVPLFVIDEVVERIKDGTISKYQYDTKLAKLVKV